MLKKYRNLWLALGLFILLSPLGLLAAGTAFGEWGMDELIEEAGYIPEGLNRFAEVWQHSLFPDYTVPGLVNTFAQSAAGYIFSALLGVGIVVAIMSLIGRRLGE